MRTDNYSVSVRFTGASYVFEGIVRYLLLYVEKWPKTRNNSLHIYTMTCRNIYVQLTDYIWTSPFSCLDFPQNPFQIGYDILTFFCEIGKYPLRFGGCHLSSYYRTKVTLSDKEPTSDVLSTYLQVKGHSFQDHFSLVLLTCNLSSPL